MRLEFTRLALVLALVVPSIARAGRQFRCGLVLKAWASDPQRFMFFPSVVSPKVETTGPFPFYPLRPSHPVTPIEEILQVSGGPVNGVSSPEVILIPALNTGEAPFVASLFDPPFMIPGYVARRAIRGQVEGQSAAQLRAHFAAYRRAQNYSFGWLEEQIADQKIKDSNDILLARELIPTGGVVHISGICGHWAELFKFLLNRPDLKKIYVSDPIHFPFDGEVVSFYPVDTKTLVKAFKKISDEPTDFKYLGNARYSLNGVEVEFVYSGADVPEASVDFTVANHPNEALKAYDAEATLASLKTGGFLWVIEGDDVIYAPFSVLRRAAAAPFDLRRYGLAIAEFQPSRMYNPAIRSTLFKVEESDPGGMDDVQWFHETYHPDGQ